jgi:hypothetical protein
MIIYDKKPKQPETIASVLSDRFKKDEPKKKVCAYQWQDYAFVIADKLGIDFKNPVNRKFLSRWFSLFKRGGQAKIDRCYSFLADYTTPLSPEGKIKMFFWKFGQK